MPVLKLPDGGVLMHGDAIYDPVKAHEYYLKTRELKGRKKGSALVPVTSGGSQRTTRGSGSVSVTFNGMTYKLTPAQHAEQQAYAAERVRNIKIKIHTLERTLKAKMAEARKNELKAKKPKTAKEKREAAKRSADYKQKHQQKIKNAAKKAAKKKQQTKHNLNTVDGLKAAISSAQTKLVEAVDRQRALATATTAKRR